MLFSLLGAKAQEAVETKIFPANQIIAPHQIEVTFQKTVHILFPSEVRYVDLGSFDIIADKAMGAENVVRIKAAVKGFEGETNFSVITADGCFYSFNVVYKDEPAQLSIEMEDWLRDNPEGGIAGDRMFVKLKELGGETPLVVNRIMYTLYKKNKGTSGISAVRSTAYRHCSRGFISTTTCCTCIHPYATGRTYRLTSTISVSNHRQESGQTYRHAGELHRAGKDV